MTKRQNTALGTGEIRQNNLDRELILRSLEGDVEAFNTLVHHWQGRVFNFILRYTGDEDASQDLCQAVFIRLYRHLPRIRHPERLSVWIYQTALNVCRDEWRRRQRRRTTSLEALESETPSPEEHPLPRNEQMPLTLEGTLHARDVRRILHQAMQAIPEAQRTVILLKIYQGLKFSEIAEVLNISENTAKSRMYYGLTALRKVLQNWNIDGELQGYVL
ncbi:MAG: sigma-70 family RNA polymerase sigma factor [Calditrichaeota bacterium]|nr:MAG: sigma-70 family RNA polymerase sigma factor [Calditrichota bacterium]